MFHFVPEEVTKEEKAAKKAAEKKAKAEADAAANADKPKKQNLAAALATPTRMKPKFWWQLITLTRHETGCLVVSTLQHDEQGAARHVIELEPNQLEETTPTRTSLRASR